MNQNNGSDSEVRDYVRNRMAADVPPDFTRDVMDDVHRTAQRRRRFAWPVGTALATFAAAIAVVVIGLGLIIQPGRVGSEQTPSPMPSPTTPPTVPLLIRNERHQAVTIEVTGRPAVTLDDCTEMVIELPLTGDWSISADGRVAYRSAELRASGVAAADNRWYPVVMLQGGEVPVLVFHEGGIPEAQVIEACRQGT
jgi:hypothetical protein